MSESANPYLYFVLFIVFVPLLILSIGIGFNMIQGTDYQTAPFVENEINQTFNGEEWLLGALDANMLYNENGGYIYPDQNSQGTWTSPIADVPRNRVVHLNYDADIADGTGNITLRAWLNEPTGDPLPPANETRSFEMETGQVTEDIDFSEYNYFQTEITMTENANDNDRFPRTNSLNVEYEILSGQQFGMDSGEIIILYTLLMFFAIAFFAIGISVKIKEGIDNV